MIQEAEGEINEILHDINKKEQTNMKHPNSDTPENKQENEYSQQSNSKLRSEEPGVISIQEMEVSSGEKQQDMIGEETDIDLIQLDEYSGKVGDEQTNMIETYLLNENMIQNIEQKSEGSKEITFQHTFRCGELESNVAADTEVVVDGITFEKSAFNMFQSLLPEEQLVEVHVQMDHDYTSNIQQTDENVVDKPKVDVNLPTVHQYANSVQTVVGNVDDQQKMNVTLPRTHEYGNSVQPSIRNTADQQKMEADIPKTHQYGRIPTKDIVFQPKHAQVLLPTRGKNLQHLEAVAHGPEELSVYMETEDAGQMKQSTRKRHIDNNVVVMSSSNLQSTSTTSGSKRFSCQFCGNHFASNSYRHKHEERMCTMNPNRKKIQCPYCEETYKHEQNFRDHISSKHTKVKSHICKVCGAAFIHQNQLTQHKQAQHKN